MGQLGNDDLDQLLSRALEGDRRSLSRLVSEALRGLPEPAYELPYPDQVIGITGAPGVGKSTLLARLAAASDSKTAVLAMDPVSPFSGGSFLADRIRMGEQKQEVYFRSLSSAAVPGGLTGGLARALRVLAAAGYQRVFVETVGSGQDEIKVHTLADTVLVIGAPGLGDDIQALKMGILEIADVYVVNKKDQPGAETLAGYLGAMLETPGAGCRICRVTQSEHCGWSPPVLLTSAEKGEGVDHLLRRIDEHGSKHQSRRSAFDEFRRLSEAVEEVDAAYPSARRAAVEAGDPGGRSVPQAIKAIMDDILRRLSKRAEEESKR